MRLTNVAVPSISSVMRCGVLRTRNQRKHGMAIRKTATNPGGECGSLPKMAQMPTAAKAQVWIVRTTKMIHFPGAQRV
jgi:hypothetical protein